MTAPETVPGQAPYKTLAVVWEAEIREAQAQSAPVSDALKLARDAVIGQKLTCLRDLQRALETVVQLEQPAPELAAVMAQLAEEMHAEAQVIAPASSEPDGIPDMADQIRAEVLHETAGRIRAGLEA